MFRSITEPPEVSQDRPHPVDMIRAHLAKHPLYAHEQDVFYREDGKNIYLHWRSVQRVEHPDRRFPLIYHTFDAQITDGIFYLLHIELEDQHRGKGWGLLLYQILEEIAKELSCHTLRMTPSGWAYARETRMQYLFRKLGYNLYVQKEGFHGEVEKKL